MKRVLLTTFPGAFLHQGGGEREILLLREALSSSGVTADIYGPSSRSVSAYDVAIHFSMVGGSEYIVKAVADEGIPLILWPNLWFVTPPMADRVQRLSEFLALFQAVVFRSQAEEDHFRRYFDLTGKDVVRASCLVSPKFLRRDVSDVFRESYSLNCYAIWPGIIEPQKNQISAIRAFKDLDLELIISGRARDDTYFARCKTEAGSNVRFIPPMSFGSELHLSALRYSSLFIELPLDFPGASAVEAATVGCRMLLSRSNWTEEVLGPLCTQVLPDDVEAIRAAVRAMVSSSEGQIAAHPAAEMSLAIDEVSRYLESIT